MLTNMGLILSHKETICNPTDIALNELHLRYFEATRRTPSSSILLLKRVPHRLNGPLNIPYDLKPTFETLHGVVTVLPLPALIAAKPQYWINAIQYIPPTLTGLPCAGALKAVNRLTCLGTEVDTSRNECNHQNEGQRIPHYGPGILQFSRFKLALVKQCRRGGQIVRMVRLLGMKLKSWMVSGSNSFSILSFLFAVQMGCHINGLYQCASIGLFFSFMKNSAGVALKECTFLLS